MSEITKQSTAANSAAYWQNRPLVRWLGIGASVLALTGCSESRPDAKPTQTPNPTSETCSPKPSSQALPDFTATYAVRAENVSVLLGERGPEAQDALWKDIKDYADESLYRLADPGEFIAYEVEAGVTFTPSRSRTEARDLADRVEMMASKRLGLPRDPDEAYVYQSSENDVMIWARGIRTPRTEHQDPACTI